MEEHDFEYYQEEAARQKAETASKRTKRTPSDLLDERRSALRRFTAYGDIPTVEQLIKHASKFGGDCVPETAAELGYGVDVLVRVIDGCDRADLAFLRKDRPNAKLDKRAPAEDRAKALLGIKDDDAE